MWPNVAQEAIQVMHALHTMTMQSTEKANDGITIPLWIAFPMTTPFFCLHLMNHVNKLLFLY